ncbi:MAG: nucleotidyltransferase family protein [Phycisphaerae bacterium]|nr:nucleotidyltransferase family protein [Phycisphaerae bacterium]
MGPPPNLMTRLARCLVDAGLSSPEPQAWFRLAEAAGREGLAGLLLESADRRRVGLPLPAHLRLREQATHIASGTAHRLRGFAPIARAFADAGMPLLLLKGAALHLTLYCRPELRPMSDVDCMVPLERAEEACALLDRLGCRRGPGLVRPDFFPTFHNELEYLTPHPDHPVRLDVHARPFRPLRYAQSVPPRAFWEDATSMKLYGASVLVPGAADMLIHLAVHAAIHGADRLLWLYDIYRFAAENSDQLDWSLVMARARAWGLLHPLRVGLHRTASVFGSFLPAEARAGLNRAHSGVLDRLALWHAPRDEAHPLGHVAVNVLSIRGWRPRLRYLAAVLRPAREHLGGLYPWRHPGWTVCAHAWRVLRAVGRGVGMRRLTHA